MVGLRLAEVVSNLRKGIQTYHQTALLLTNLEYLIDIYIVYTI